MEKKRLRFPSPLLVLFVLALLSVVVSAVLILRILGQSTNFLFSSRADVLLPDWVGADTTQVQSSTEFSQLQIIWEQSYDSTVPTGAVCRQKPAAGRTLKEGQQVTLTVSLGTQWVSVPDVCGLTQSEAAAALREAGFKVAAEFVQDNTLESYTVIKTEPAAGASLTEGETVTVTVAQPVPDPWRTCPNVYGKSLAEAKSLITQAGLTPVTVPADAVSGTVYATDPEPAHLVRQFGAVTLYVN